MKPVTDVEFALLRSILSMYESAIERRDIYTRDLMRNALDEWAMAYFNERVREELKL